MASRALIPLFLLLIVQAVPAGPVPESVREFVTRVAAAIERGDVDAVFDFEGMVAILEDQDFLTTDAAGSSTGVALVRSSLFPRILSRFSCRLVPYSFEPAADENGGLLVVHRQDEDGLLEPVRWHLVRSGDSWRIRDFEGIRFPLRASTRAALDLSETDPEGLGWKAAARSFVEAEVNLALEDLDPGFERTLAALEAAGSGELPGFLEALRLYLLATLRIRTGDPDAAKAAVDRAAELGEELPVLDLTRAAIFNRQGEPQRALEAARRYRVAVGSDSLVELEIGRAHAALGQRDEALAAYERGLAIDPDDGTLLLLLGVALPRERKHEIKERLAGLLDFEEQFPAMADFLVEQRDAVTLRRFVEALEDALPGDPRAVYYTGEALRIEGKLEEAGRTFASCLPHLEDPVLRERGEQACYRTMVQAGSAVAAFEEAQRKHEAFSSLAAILAEAARTDELRDLLRIASARDDPPPDLEDYRWELRWLEGHHGEALAGFEALRERLFSRSGPGDEGGRRRLWRIEDRIVRGLIRADRLARALAEARAIDHRDDDSLYLGLVHAAAGRTEAAVVSLLECVRDGRPGPTVLEDEDVRRLLPAGAYRELSTRLTSRPSPETAPAEAQNH